MIIACIDGGIFCVPLMILICLGLGGCAKYIRTRMLNKKYGECGTCECPCHKEPEVDGQEEATE